MVSRGPQLQPWRPWWPLVPLRSSWLPGAHSLGAPRAIPPLTALIWGPAHTGTATEHFKLCPLSLSNEEIKAERCALFRRSRWAAARPGTASIGPSPALKRCRNLRGGAGTRLQALSMQLHRTERRGGYERALPMMGNTPLCRQSAGPECGVSRSNAEQPDLLSSLPSLLTASVL